MLFDVDLVIELDQVNWHFFTILGVIMMMMRFLVLSGMILRNMTMFILCPIFIAVSIFDETLKPGLFLQILRLTDLMLLYHSLIAESARAKLGDGISGRDHGENYPSFEHFNFNLSNF